MTNDIVKRKWILTPNPTPNPKNKVKGISTLPSQGGHGLHTSFSVFALAAALMPILHHHQEILMNGKRTVASTLAEKASTAASCSSETPNGSQGLLTDTNMVSRTSQKHTFSLLHTHPRTESHRLETKSTM